jgi:hypothetical protein
MMNAPDEAGCTTQAAGMRSFRPWKGSQMGLDPRCLQIGQTINVRELNYGVEINPPLEGETGLTVLAVDGEHLVLDDAAGGTRSIPVYLIHKPDAVKVESSEAA